RGLGGPGRVARPGHEADPQDRVGAAARKLPLDRQHGRLRERRRPDQYLHARLHVQAALDEQLRVGLQARIGGGAQNSHLPFSWTSSPSSSIRPPGRRSLTMSQWTELSFVPFRKPKPWPIARWTVPSIFSSNRVFRMCSWIP